MRFGILALQGAFAEHGRMCGELGADSFEIRCRRDIEKAFDGLIIPGGESTVMGKLLRELELFEPLKKLIDGGFPVLGTCAGLILLAKNIVNDDRTHLATMDISVKRNAYGRQLGSFYTTAGFAGAGTIPMTFIRAPYIESVSADTEILAEVNQKIVAARQRNQVVTAFHPELNADTTVYSYFMEIAASN